jgi:hypothetical protein
MVERGSGAGTDLRRKSPAVYGITGKSAINQGSPGTELGNCLLKNRNDVNPGERASERASGRAAEARARTSAIRKIRLIRPKERSLAAE